MTALHAPRVLAPATPFERTLLRTADSIDAFVADRLAARAARRTVGRVTAQAEASDRRATAQAGGGLGMLPR